MNEVTQQSNAGSTFSLTPKSLEEAMAFAQILSKASIVPKDYQGNPGNVIIAVQWGAEIGLPPLQAMQNLAVVNGRPSLWGDAMIALVRGSGKLEAITEDVGDTSATCTVKRKGEAPTSRTFTMEDAKRAGLAGKQGPWSQYPKRMLQMRARAWALRDVFPDVLRGVAMAEEAQDQPAEKHMGTAEQVPPPAIAAPASRAEKARAAVAKAAKPAPAPALLPAPGLDEVLGGIHAAKTLEELQAAAMVAAHLESEDEKQVARDAFSSRKAQLHAPAPVVQADDDFVAEMDAEAQ